MSADSGEKIIEDATLFAEAEVSAKSQASISISEEENAIRHH